MQGKGSAEGVTIGVLFVFPIPHLHLLPTFPNVRAVFPLSQVTHSLSDRKHVKFLPIHEQSQMNYVENILMTDFCVLLMIRFLYLPTLRQACVLWVFTQLHRFKCQKPICSDTHTFCVTQVMRFYPVNQAVEEIIPSFNLSVIKPMSLWLNLCISSGKTFGLSVRAPGDD